MSNSNVDMIPDIIYLQMHFNYQKSNNKQSKYSQQYPIEKKLTHCETKQTGVYMVYWDPVDAVRQRFSSVLLVDWLWIVGILQFLEAHQTPQDTVSLG